MDRPLVAMHSIGGATDSPLATRSHGRRPIVATTTTTTTITIAITTTTREDGGTHASLPGAPCSRHRPRHRSVGDAVLGRGPRRWCTQLRILPRDLVELLQMPSSVQLPLLGRPTALRSTVTLRLFDRLMLFSNEGPRDACRGERFRIIFRATRGGLEDRE